MPTGISNEVEETIRVAKRREIDRSFLPQAALDVATRTKVSALAWRGQFTPDLAMTLLNAYAKPGYRVLDPFVGSGTTLNEAMSLGMPSIGCEINPAAVELSRIFEVAALSPRERARLINLCGEAFNRLTVGSGDLLAALVTDQLDVDGPTLVDRILSEREKTGEPYLANLIAVSLMIAMGNGHGLDDAKLARAFRQVAGLVSTFPRHPVPCEVLAADARRLPIDTDSVDLVLTSPPYINVFNYHQNYRPAIELLGYDVLSAAQAEIGSNRKFRQNRFMTVVQYCLDMMLALRELNRVVKPSHKAVVVVGRESRVRGVPFDNGLIVCAIAEISGGLKLVRWQERSFTSRFGEKIYEEILTFDVTDSDPLSEDVALKLAGEVSRFVLGQAAPSDKNEDVLREINEALDAEASIRPSSWYGVERNRGRRSK